MHRQAYYGASAEAERVVDRIDEILWGIAEEVDLNSQEGSEDAAMDSGVFQEYLMRVNETLNGQQIEGISVHVEQAEEGSTVSFRVPAGDRQELMVLLQVTDYREHVNYYEIRAWETVRLGGQEEEQPLRLLPVIE
ncbi:MAG: hypothetical protein K2O13_07175 [Lachnospiraceae bacterium]|nr:hypothetical protein [Lachnospiraceae bacterium]